MFAAQTPEKIALGQKLFFDGRLSADKTVACSTCHDPARAFTDGRPVSIGIHGRAGASLTSADYKQQGIKELARQRALSLTTRPQRDTARAFGPNPRQPKPASP
jgi:cytochrome c peroxidase